MALSCAECYNHFLLRPIMTWPAPNNHPPLPPISRARSYISTWITGVVFFLGKARVTCQAPLHPPVFPTLQSHHPPFSPPSNPPTLMSVPRPSVPPPSSLPHPPVPPAPLRSLHPPVPLPLCQFPHLSVPLPFSPPSSPLSPPPYRPLPPDPSLQTPTPNPPFPSPQPPHNPLHLNCRYKLKAWWVAMDES